MTSDTLLNEDTESQIDDNALASYLQRLKIARNDYDSSPNVKGKKIAIEGSLSIAIDYLHNSGVPGDLTKPLIDLLVALGELDKGIVSPFLMKVKPKDGAPPLSEAVRQARAKAAFACEVLYRSNMSLVEAASHCARQLKGVATKKQVARWRSGVSGGAASEDIDTRIYRSFAEKCDASVGRQEAIQMADEFLRSARTELTRWKNPENPPD